MTANPVTSLKTMEERSHITGRPASFLLERVFLPRQETRTGSTQELNHQAAKFRSHTLNNYTYVLFQVPIRQTKETLLLVFMSCFFIKRNLIHFNTFK